jgi:hypothetical protein
VRIGRLHVHTTNLASGLIFIVLGVPLGIYGGTGGLMGLFEPPAVVGWETGAQHEVGQLQTHLSDLSLLGIAAAVVVLAGLGLRRRVS